MDASSTISTIPQNQNELVESILASSISGIMAFSAVRDENGKIVDFKWTLVNPMAETMVGFRRDDLIGQNLLQVMPGNRDEGLFDIYRTSVLKMEARRFQKYYSHEKIDSWFDISVQPLSDGFVVTFTDISDIKRSEKRAVINEARLNSILATAPIGIMTFDKSLCVDLCSNEAARIFGYEQSLMSGMSLETFVPKRFHERHDVLSRDFNNGPDRQLSMSDWRIVSGLRQDGTEVPLLVALRKVTLNGESITTFAFRDMSEIKDREAQLSKLVEQNIKDRESVEGANKAKSRFLAALSHELRTPLNAILGYSEILRDHLLGVLSPETTTEYSTQIHDSASHLLGLINDLIDLSRVEAGEYHLEPEALDFETELSAVVALLGATINSANLTISKEIEAKLPMILFDQRNLKQILINIFSNAVKYVGISGTVAVQATRVSDKTGDFVEVSFSDNGPGYPKNVVSNFGMPFLTRQEGFVASESTGMGLAIVKGLIEANGGSVLIGNAEDGGSETIIRFVISG